MAWENPGAATLLESNPLQQLRCERVRTRTRGAGETRSGPHRQARASPRMQSQQRGSCWPAGQAPHPTQCERPPGGGTPLLPGGQCPHQASGHGVEGSRLRPAGARWGRRWGAGLAGQREEEVGRPLPARPAPRSAPAAPALPDVLAVQLDVVGALLTEQRAPVSHD